MYEIQYSYGYTGILYVFHCYIMYSTCNKSTHVLTLKLKDALCAVRGADPPARSSGTVTPPLAAAAPPPAPTVVCARTNAGGGSAGSAAQRSKCVQLVLPARPSRRGADLVALLTQEGTSTVITRVTGNIACVTKFAINGCNCKVRRKKQCVGYGNEICTISVYE